MNRGVRRASSRAGRGTGIAAAILLVALAACGEKGEGPPATPREKPPPGTARTSAERGPVKLTVECTPAPCRLSDEVKLTLTIDAAEGVEVEKPPFGKAIGDFLIRDFHEPLPEVRPGRRVIRQVYTLEPARTGECFIQPICVAFKDTRPEGDGGEHRIESEALKVTVTSILGDAAPKLSDLHPPAGPVALPGRPGRAWLWAGGAALLLAAGGVLLFHRRRRRAVPPEETLSPRERAYLALKALLESDLAGRDVKGFYVELTGIVRRYIEGTTGIRAPEQTTEEFLHEVERTGVFRGEERRRLQAFLEAADLVKFAGFRPGKEEIEASFERAKAFVGLAGGAREAAA